MKFPRFWLKKELNNERVNERMKNKLFAKLKFETAKKVVISGPSGFLGSQVVDYFTEYNLYRQEHNQEPNEIILLSSSPGTDTRLFDHSLTRSLTHYLTWFL